MIYYSILEKIKTKQHNWKTKIHFLKSCLKKNFKKFEENACNIGNMCYTTVRNKIKQAKSLKGEDLNDKRTNITDTGKIWRN